MAELQDRWGSSAVRRLGQMQRGPVPHVPTGFPALDAALAIGGLPSGRITEIVGVPTSGMATLALTISAQVQKRSGPVFYIDLGCNFDAEYADYCGLDLNRLVLIQPKDAFQALHILQDFVAGGGIGALVFDVEPSTFNDPQHTKALATTLDKIIAPLSQTKFIVLFLTSKKASKNAWNKTASSYSLIGYPGDSIIPHHSSVRLHIQREKWFYKDGDICGYQALIVVAKNKLGPTGKEVSFSVFFSGSNSVNSVIATGNGSLHSLERNGASPTPGGDK